MNDGDGHLALLDGIHRLDALELLGREIAPNNHNIFGKPLPAMKDSEICALVRSLNLERRHVTNKEKRDLIAKLLKADPGKSNRQIAKLTKADDKTVASVRRKKEATAEIPQLEATVGADGKKRVAKKRRTPEDFQRDIAKKNEPDPETERDRKQCVALYQAVEAAEREKAERFEKQAKKQ